MPRLRGKVIGAVTGARTALGAVGAFGLWVWLAPHAREGAGWLVIVLTAVPLIWPVFIVAVLAIGATLGAGIGEILSRGEGEEISK
jgi:hypothetical protein